jgi:hypothetical protein
MFQALSSRWLSKTNGVCILAPSQEDPRIDHTVLKCNRDDHVITIASAGQQLRGLCQRTRVLVLHVRERTPSLENYYPIKLRGHSDF